MLFGGEQSSLLSSLVFSLDFRFILGIRIICPNYFRFLWETVHVRTYGRNMIAINQELEVVHHQLEEFAVMRDVFQEFIARLIDQVANTLPVVNMFQHFSTLWFSSSSKELVLLPHAAAVYIIRLLVKLTAAV